jgi:hypothetical protein
VSTAALPNQSIAAEHTALNSGLVRDRLCAVSQAEDLITELEKRLINERKLRQSDSLRHSRLLRAKIERLYDMMVVESRAHMTTEEKMKLGMECTIVGYTAMHMRLSKLLHKTDHGDFSADEAKAGAQVDWQSDCVRYSRDSHIVMWLDDIRRLFKSHAAQAVSAAGFRAVFQKIDEGERQSTPLHVTCCPCVLARLSDAHSRRPLWGLCRWIPSYLPLLGIICTLCTSQSRDYVAYTRPGRYVLACTGYHTCIILHT